MHEFGQAAEAGRAGWLTTIGRHFYRCQPNAARTTAQVKGHVCFSLYLQAGRADWGYQGSGQVYLYYNVVANVSHVDRPSAAGTCTPETYHGPADRSYAPWGFAWFHLRYARVKAVLHGVQQSQYRLMSSQCHDRQCDVPQNDLSGISMGQIIVS